MTADGTERERKRIGKSAVTEGRSLAYVAEQAGHSIATLAKHCAGAIRALEDASRKPTAEVIRQARERIRCAQMYEARKTSP
jgi:hypothetical protein